MAALTEQEYQRLPGDERAAEELLHQQYIPGMNELSWDDLVERVKQHPDFGDALIHMVKGDCSVMRSVARASAVSLVREHFNRQKGKA